MNENIDTLRTHLFDAMKGLKDGSMTVEKAKAMSDIAQTIINSAKVEVDYIKATDAKGSGFLDKGQELPKGITGVTVHKIK